jgi:hypothetical protein
MPIFRATFSTWVNDAQPAMEEALKDNPFHSAETRSFFVEAVNEGHATMIAKEYEGVETHAHEGLAILMSVTAVGEEEAKNLPNLHTYQFCIR